MKNKNMEDKSDEDNSEIDIPNSLEEKIYNSNDINIFEEMINDRKSLNLKDYQKNNKIFMDNRISNYLRNTYNGDELVISEKSNEDSTFNNTNKSNKISNNSENLQKNNKEKNLNFYNEYLKELNNDKLLQSFDSKLINKDDKNKKLKLNKNLKQKKELSEIKENLNFKKTKIKLNKKVKKVVNKKCKKQIKEKIITKNKSKLNKNNNNMLYKKRSNILSKDKLFKFTQLKKKINSKPVDLSKKEKKIKSLQLKNNDKEEQLLIKKIKNNPNCFDDMNINIKNGMINIMGFDIVYNKKNIDNVKVKKSLKLLRDIE